MLKLFYIWNQDHSQIWTNISVYVSNDATDALLNVSRIILKAQRTARLRVVVDICLPGGSRLEWKGRLVVVSQPCVNVFLYEGVLKWSIGERGQMGH